MLKKTKYSIYFGTAFLLVVGLYLYFANGFIYYRIGAGNLSAPIIKEAYFMNENSTSTSEILYVALGDSLTTGAGVTQQVESFPYQIAERLASNEKRVIMENFSYPGATTQDLINDLLDRTISAQPDVVTILIGVNDIHNHVNSEQFRINYRYILERLSNETNSRIYVINIPLIGSKTAILPPLDLYFDAQTKKFNNIIKELANDYNIKYIDLYEPTKKLLREDGPHYSSDSFHPSAEGYKWWTDIIYDSFNR
jgi:lysophospholipase L1-like esterase